MTAADVNRLCAPAGAEGPAKRGNSDDFATPRHGAGPSARRIRTAELTP